MTPRDKFRQNPELAGGYNDLVDGPQMQAAFDAAMLEYVGSLKLTDDMDIASANYFRLRGAQEFLNELKMLNTTTPPSKPSTTGQLDHKA